MREYLVELSKYIITFTVALYALESFLIFRLHDKKRQSISYGAQTGLIFLTQFFCFMTLYCKSGDKRYLFFYLFLQVFFLTVLCLTPLIYPSINRLLLHNMCMLLGLGFVILGRLSPDRAIRQFCIAAAVFLAGLFWPALFRKLNLPHQKYYLFYAVSGIAVLSVVLLVGKLTRGSKLSLSFLHVTFQPSEAVKLLFIIFLAAALCQDVSFKRVEIVTLLAALHVAVLAVSKDLGSALIFFVGFVFLVFLATGSYLYLGLGTLGGCISAVCAYFLFPHVRVRVLAFLKPFTYIDNQSYQITQSMFALGNGSWFGTGLLNGRPEDIPDVITDFIFSAICEELGVISGVCLILICLSCFVCMMRMGMGVKDSFGRLTVMGFGVIYIFQVFLTIGGGIKFIPLTGVTLPFVSYGGSSILASITMFMLIQSIWIKEREGGSTRGGKQKTAVQKKKKP